MRKIQISQPATGLDEWEATRESILSGWMTSGPKVAKFEKEFAEVHGVKHAIATTSATTALHLCLAALKIGPGDEVIVPAFTWVATANVVLYCGATPVFVDIDINTFNLNPDLLKNKITERTKAIIPVHLFGLCANMPKIKEIVGDIPLIEDAACAAGAKLGNAYAGNLGTLGCFSFHPRKAITTGEGGMITTNDDELAALVSKLRSHGAEISEEQRHHGAQPYILPDFNVLGFNYRMTDMQGAIGSVQLTKMAGFITERQKWAEFYQKELSEVKWLKLPKISGQFSHGWQSFVTVVDELVAPFSRNEIMKILQEKGISTRPGTHAVHMLNYYKNNFGFEAKDFPSAELANNCSMAIPLHNKMEAEDYKYIVNTLLSI